MRGMHVFFALNLLIWGGLALLGVGLTDGVANRHVPGYPNAGQIDYYVWTPVAMVAIALGTYLLSYLRRATWLCLTVEICAFLFFFPHMLSFTGGV